MNNIITNYLSTLKLQELQGFENMSLFPLSSPVESNMHYITLNDALQSGMLKITEIDESGSVPELKVFNDHEAAVFLLDGEELAGAKQNRVINTSILLKAKSETIIPVSCTEQGRWSYTSTEFYDSGIVMPSKLRASKSASVSSSLQSRNRFESDQGSVWDDIQAMSIKENVSSATSAMRDVYENKMVDLDQYIKAFSALDDQKGILVVINGKVAGLDFISRKDVYGQLHGKLIKSYAMEAIIEKKKSNGKSPHDAAETFLGEIKKCNDKEFTSVGIGWDHRFDREKIVGSSLQTESEVIHMSFFKTTDSEKTGNISSLSTRRRYRI